MPKGFWTHLQARDARPRDKMRRLSQRPGQDHGISRERQTQVSWPLLLAGSTQSLACTCSPRPKGLGDTGKIHPPGSLTVAWSCISMAPVPRTDRGSRLKADLSFSFQFTTCYPKVLLLLLLWTHTSGLPRAPWIIWAAGEAHSY